MHAVVIDVVVPDVQVFNAIVAGQRVRNVSHGLFGQRRACKEDDRHARVVV